MFSDTLFRMINIAGGLGLDHDLWRRQVLGAPTAVVRTGEIRRRIEAALARGEASSQRSGVDPDRAVFCRTAG